MPSRDSALDTFTAWLRQRWTAVRECERLAGTALYDNNNESAYRDLMKQKATLLASLAENAAPFLRALSGQEKQRVQDSLDMFSKNAQTALRLDSVFYMSALLYPDNHQKGEPDNLEQFIASLS